MAKIPYLWLYLLLIFLFISCDNESMSKVTVTFNTDGGTEIASQTVQFDEALDPVVAPEKDGFSFKGWYIDAEFNQEFNFSKTLEDQFKQFNANITLYAKYLPRIYRVIYNGNGHTEGEVPVDDNLYVTGEVVMLKSGNAFDVKLKKENDNWKFWEVKGALPRYTSGNVQPHAIFADGTLWVTYQELLINECNVEVTASYEEPYILLAYK